MSGAEQNDGTLHFRFDGKRSAAHRDSVITPEMQEAVQDRLASLSESKSEQPSSSGALRLWKIPPARYSSATAAAGSSSEGSAGSDPDSSTAPSVTKHSRGADRRPPEVLAAKKVMVVARRDWKNARAEANLAWKTKSPSIADADAKALHLKGIWREAQSALEAAEQAAWSNAPSKPRSSWQRSQDHSAADADATAVGLRQDQQDESYGAGKDSAGKEDVASPSETAIPSTDSAEDPSAADSHSAMAQTSILRSRQPSMPHDGRSMRMIQ